MENFMENKNLTDEKKSCTEKSFLRLLEIIKTLRSENGCPWDKKQTPQSMRPCLVEETFELVDALTKNDLENSKEELGDLLFNTLLVMHMFQQNNDFSVSDVFDCVSEKILRRHPHVDFDEKLFSDGQAPQKKCEEKSVDEINKKWNEIKNEVEGRKKDCVLDQVPENFPPLLKAYKYLKKAASQGFEWPVVDDAKNKILEEMREVQEAVDEKSTDHLEDEIGDLILSVVNYSRLLGINPEIALARANKKFYDRYSYVEKNMKDQKIPMEKSNLEKMEELWKEAKKYSR